MSVFKTLFFQSHKRPNLRAFSGFSLFRATPPNKGSEPATTRPSKPLRFPSFGGDPDEPSERPSARANNLVDYAEKRIDETQAEIPKDAKLFLRHLYKGGYLNDAVFLTENRAGGDGDDDLDFSCFENGFARGFVSFAAEKFGKDNQEIAKWLSGNDMKRVALFGCPSLARKNVFAAKRLRKFFEIQEDTVCTKCALKQSCKFVNQNVWKTDTKKLALIDVLNVITHYALESPPPRLVVPAEIKTSITRLLNEVVKLSQTTSRSK